VIYRAGSLLVQTSRRGVQISPTGNGFGRQWVNERGGVPNRPLQVADAVRRVQSSPTGKLFRWGGTVPDRVTTRTASRGSVDTKTATQMVP
jgi:hypothetical protein